MAFRLKQYRALWGMINATDGHLARSPHTQWEEFLPAVAALGYDGIEAPLKFLEFIGRDKAIADLKAHGLGVIFQIFTDGPVAPGGPGLWGGKLPGYTEPVAAGESDKRKVVEEHLTVFKEQVEAAQAYDPDVVNAHSCKDFFTPAMADDFFRRALAWQEEQGFDVLHETHRKAS